MIRSDSTGDHVLSIVPNENIEAYTFIFAIEVGLRELIIERLGELDGYQWYKRRLPPDIVKKYREGRSRERASRWTQFVPHDPLYYIDFPELSKVMGNGSNWRDAFQNIFGSRDVMLGNLKSLEEIRNKIAHNRKATKEDVRIIRSVYQQIETSVGSDKLQVLVGRCSSASDAAERLEELHAEAVQCFNACASCERLPPRETWQEVQESSWLGMVSLSVDLDPIVRYFSLLDEYSEQTPNWPGFRIERWNRSNALDEAYNSADAALTAMLGEVQNG